MLAVVTSAGKVGGNGYPGHSAHSPVFAEVLAQRKTTAGRGRCYPQFNSGFPRHQSLGHPSWMATKPRGGFFASPRQIVTYGSVSSATSEGAENGNIRNVIGATLVGCGAVGYSDVTCVLALPAPHGKLLLPLFSLQRERGAFHAQASRMRICPRPPKTCSTAGC